MAAALPWVLPTAVGALGLYNSNKQANAARSAGNQMLAPQKAAQTDIYNLAHNYNPAAEDQQAISAANQNANLTFQKSLGDLNGNFLSAGGSPTGDTAFNVNATNAGNRAIDPLRAYTAQLLSTESQRKADMLGRVFGAQAGQIANTYFQQANGAQGDAGNALGLFIQGLGKMPWFAPPAVGSTGATPAGTNPLYAPGSAAYGQDQWT